MWTKNTPLAALLFTARFGAGVEATLRSPKSPKEPKSPKGPKTVCLEYGLETEVVAAGSTTPVGANGPTGIGACSAGLGVCCTELAACYVTGPDPTSVECIAYETCLRDPANGPVVVGDWWLQADVYNGEVYFTEDAMCGRISVTDDDSRTRMQLWDADYLGMDLDLFKKFSVDYNFVTTGGSSGGYLNLYLRTSGNAQNAIYFDCRLDFAIPNQQGEGTLEVHPYTLGTSNQWDPTSGTAGNDNGCPAGGQISILDYLADNPTAVMGVGTGESYAFVLNGGSTGQNNNGQEICWSDLSIQNYDDNGEIIVKTWDFTTL